MLTGSTHEEGFTLIEVLVAMVIVAIGLIGMAGINAASVKYTKGAEGRSHAAELAYDMLDRMRANQANLQNGAYSVGGGFVATVCDNTFVSGATIQEVVDVNTWRNQLACLLPSGRGQIVVGALDITTQLYPVTITVSWDESRIKAGVAAHEYILRSQI